MKINKIILKNYRQFRGVHTIDFSPKKNKNINIILGNNGFGKSNTYSAINWCLFGDDQQKHQRLNFKVRDDLKIGKTKKVSVIIELKGKDENNKNRITTIERIESFKKIQHKNIAAGTPSKARSKKKEFFLSYYTTQGLKELEGVPAENYLNNKIISTDIKDFFFLDGQQIQKFVLKNSTTDISGHLDILTSITDMQGVLKNLTTLQKKLEKKAPSQSNSELEEEIHEKRNQVNNLIDTMNHSKENVQRLNEQKQRIESKILDLKKRVSTHYETKLIINKRNDLDRRILQCRENISMTQEADYLNIIEHFAGTVANKHLKEYKNLIDKKVDDEDLPKPTIEGADDIIDFMIDENKLVIQDKIFADIKWKKSIDKDKFKKSIEDYNEFAMSQRDSKMAKIALEVNDFVVAALADTKPKEVLQESKDAYQRIKDFNTSLDKMLKEHVDLTSQIGDGGAENIKDDAAELRGKENLLSDLNIEYGAYLSKYQSSEKQIKEIEKEINKKESKLGKTSNIHHEINFIKRSIEILKPSIAETRATILSSTNKVFADLFEQNILKKNTYDVKIKDDYSLDIMHRIRIEDMLPRGKEPLISTGEQFLLGYSYMQSMQESVQLRFPIIIDTPLSAIDMDLRDGIMNRFVDLANRFDYLQFTFLFTNSELTPDIEAILKPKIGKFIKIHAVDSGDKSTEDSYYEVLS
jgi:DNA sulfur modification protein DndD